MDSIDFIKQIIKRLKKISWAILLFALAFGCLFYYIAKKDVVKYTSLATVFPLSSASDNSSLANSALGNALGLASDSKSFSSEASINIVELANSRRTRETVARIKVKKLGNKTFAQLLIEENNLHIGLLQNKYIKIPKDSVDLINIGTAILKENLSAKISKTNILELSFKNSDPTLVRLISYAFVDKISEFYIKLKKEKAQLDYEFAERKVDSLLLTLKKIDENLIKLDESSFFANENLQRYSLPKLNLEQERQVIQQQYFYAIRNREDAAYKLQKETPIIKILDNPEPPYLIEKRSVILYIAIGLILGTFLGILLLNWKIISTYIKHQINKALQPNDASNIKVEETK